MRGGALIVKSESVQTIEALYEGFRLRDMGRIFSLLSPDVEIVQSDSLPWGGSYRGHEGAREFFGKLGAHLNSTLTIERFIDAGGHVAAVGWTEGTVRATGTAYRVPIVHVWKVKDGVVSGVQFLIDHPTMFVALGRG
jgi:ketosteroid isomerase-like protein